MWKCARSAAVVLACGLMLQGCQSQSADVSSPEVTTKEVGTLGHSLATATRDICIPYVVDAVSAASLTQRPGVSQRHYNIHGQEVVRFRLDDLPGGPEVSFHGNECQARIEEAPLSAVSALVSAFRTELRLDRHRTSEVELVPGPHTLVVGHGNEHPALPLSYSTCVHGRGHALVQMTNGLVDVTSDPDVLAVASCIPKD